MSARLTGVLVVGLVLGACAKHGAPEKAASAPQESEAQQQQYPGAPPPPGAAPQDELAGEPAPEEDKKPSSLDADDAPLATLAQAEAALRTAEARLTTLLGAQGATPLASGDRRCADGCKAFASLRRAADAICRLAGDADSRCSRARKVVSDNDARLKACACAV